MKSKYIELVLEEFFRKKENRFVIHLNEFIEETGMDRKEVIKYLLANNWTEATIGTYQLR